MSVGSAAHTLGLAAILVGLGDVGSLRPDSDGIAAGIILALQCNLEIISGPFPPAFNSVLNWV